MRILIIETRRCHFEILPTWAKILEGHQLIFWSNSYSKKMGISPLLEEFDNIEQRVSLFRPLSKSRHFDEIKKINPELIILNSAETERPEVTAQSIYKKTGVPILALCHEKQTAERILAEAHPHITACTLSPQLSDFSHTIFAVHYSSQLKKTLNTSRGLKLIIPGSVSPDRRHYSLILEIHKHLKKEDQIIVLGSCPSSYRNYLKSILEKCPQVTHVDSAKEFPGFLDHITSSHGILSLVEPEMSRFKKYTTELISGSINLSIGLQRPLIGNAKYLESVEVLNDSNSIAYESGYVSKAIEMLRIDYNLFEKALEEEQSKLLTYSRENIHHLISKVV